RRLILLAEVSAAGFVSLLRIDTHQLCQFEKVSDSTGFFEALVQIIPASGNSDVLPEFLTQCTNFSDGDFKPLGCAGHSAVIPDNLAQFAMERIHRALALNRKQLVNRLLDILNNALYFAVGFVNLCKFMVRKV